MPNTSTFDSTLPNRSRTDGLPRRKTTRFWWLPGLVVLCALIFSYRSIIVTLFHQMLRNDTYSGGLLIVPVCVYLIWSKRGVLETLEIKPDWRALVALVLAIAVFIAGELGAELFTTRVSLLVFLIGSVWLLYGMQVLKALRFPLVFLFLMLPLPGFIYRNLTFPLQLLASALSVNLLQLFGISVYREGNVIDLGFTRLQVVEACNGLRFILPLVIIGVLMAFFSKKPLWKRLFLIAASIPIAITANVFRIAGTGLTAQGFGMKAAEGFFHFFSGWAVFMLCFGLFVILSFALDKIPGTHTSTDQPEPAEPAARIQEGGVNLRWSPALIGAAVVLASPAIVHYFGSVPAVPLSRPLIDFPRTYGHFKGRPSSMREKIWDRVGGQDYVIIDYTGDGRPPVNFYAVYYEHQRKAGDFIHSPKLCLPGAGWYIRESRVRRLPVQNMAINGGHLTFNDLVIQKDDLKQLVYYWYQGRGRNFTNEFSAKFYMVWDGVFRRRTDGALVQLIRSIAPGEAEEDARRVLDPFAKFVSRTLAEYLPN